MHYCTALQTMDYTMVIIMTGLLLDYGNGLKDDRQRFCTF